MRIILHKIYLVAFILNFCGPKLNSQVFDPSDYRKELSIKISVIDEKRIEKGVKILNEAYAKEAEALAHLETLKEDEKHDATSSEYKKAVKELIEASEVYREGHILIYTVFQENCLKFGEEMKKMNHTASGVNKAKFYERKGTKAFNRALSKRDLIQMIEKPQQIQYKMAESLELERLSIRDRGRAVQIYQDFPVEYNYNWEDDVTDEEVRAAFKDPSVSLPPDDLFVQLPAEEILKDTTKEPPIVFRVQIAAHTIPIDEEYIRSNIYLGSMAILEVHEGAWYKYTIGSFDNFRDASNLLKNCAVKRAFVVSYQEGRRITIKEAMAKIKANQ
jgi:hypothetical protein